jgi:LuxR family transcriptional regulator, maltose regulon positive regulatory protein
MLYHAKMGGGRIAMPGQQLAKLSRPKLYDAIVRERLFRSLDEKREHPVVWIAGPPGSGKTTLVASYLEKTSAQAIWYLLDKGDSDPASFIYYLAQAIGAAHRASGKPLPLLTPEYLPDLEGFARRFARTTFQRLPEGYLLVLDNYHEIAADSPLHRMLNAMSAEVPNSANLIVISRAPPPPVFGRARVGGTIETLEWEELRLDPEETAAIVARRRGFDAKAVAAIHSQSGGWVAGVRLLLERAGSEATSDVAVRPEMLERTFDYFASEILGAAPAALQEFLLRTAFLPRFTAQIAAVVSGDDRAARYLEELYTKRLFVDRRAATELTYQYHDLFRAFLRSRAVETFPPEEVAALTSQSGQLLLAAHLAEEAFGLFVQAGDWTAAEQIFLEQAQELIARGRWKTLEDWGNALPPVRFEANPWLWYWLGRSKALVNASEAFPMLETAYGAFRDRADNFGQLLCAATVVETLHFVVEHWDRMGLWLERVQKGLERQLDPLSPDDELRIHAALFWAADNSFDPASPIVAPSVAKTVELLPHCTDVNLRVSVANMLQYHCERYLDHEVARIAAREARPFLDSPDLSPDRHALYYLAEGFAHIYFAEHREAFECYDRADALIAANGLVGRDHIAGVWRTFTECAAGQFEAAKATLARTETLNALDLHVITSLLEQARSWVAFGEGDIARALEHNQRSIDIAVRLGPYSAISILLPNHAYMLITCGQHSQAPAVLNRIRKERRLVDFNHVGGAIALLEAWAAHRSGDPVRCEEYLREGLALARDRRDRLRIRWYPKALEELLPIAFERDIQPEAARLLISECSLTPTPSAPEQWPWGVRIYTLGRFEVLVNEKPLEFGRKAPKRTIALLKALIAMGGKDIAEQRLADALWPDLEGDAGLESLAAALHRLRRLLGGNEAIRQSNGTLSLSNRHCFVDAWAFEAGALTADTAPSALRLYRGDFLEGDADAPWSVSMREHLRGRFIRAIQSIGDALEKSGCYCEGLEYYTRGIEADDLVEPFYQGAIRCFYQLDRAAEAASMFRRLRQTLSLTLGVPPSAESQKLFETLRTK